MPVNNKPTESDKKKQEKKIEERKQEFIANFMTTLEADDFQKEIIKQYINSFFEAKIAALKIPYEHNIDRQEAIKKLENAHFKELEELISENDMKKIKDMISGKFKESEVIKDKKKKKKKRKKKKNKS